MANEAVIIELMGQPKGVPIRYTISDAVAIPKGTIMKCVDPRRAEPTTTSSNVETFAGIAASEKVANDGQTTLGLWTKGIFDLKNADPVAAGEMLCISGANFTRVAADADYEPGQCIGKSLEIAAAATAESIAVAVGIY